VSIDLFGEAPAVNNAIVPGVKKRREARPNGYAGIPGTGPEGRQCRHCDHYTHKGGVAGSYPKCNLCRTRWTGGRATDILARSPACSYFRLEPPK
jgi:hypothetical protein